MQSTKSPLTNNGFASLLCNACQKPFLYAWRSVRDSDHCMDAIEPQMKLNSQLANINDEQVMVAIGKSN